MTQAPTNPPSLTTESTQFRCPKCDSRYFSTILLQDGLPQLLQCKGHWNGRTKGEKYKGCSWKGTWDEVRGHSITATLAESAAEVERLTRYEKELEQLSGFVQSRHPIGAVKHIGLMEAVEAAKQVILEHEANTRTPPAAERGEEFGVMLEFEKQFTETAFLVEATGYEQLSIWEEYNQRVAWQQDNPGCFLDVGRIGGLPVCISVAWNIIGGHRVAFWEAVSRAVDTEKIDQWFDRHCNPMRGDRKCRTNAMNFHHVIQELGIGIADPAAPAAEAKGEPTFPLVLKPTEMRGERFTCPDCGGHVCHKDVDGKVTCAGEAFVYFSGCPGKDRWQAGLAKLKQGDGR